MKTKENVQKKTEHDPVKTRLQRISRSLKNKVQLRQDGLWITYGDRLIHLEVPDDIKAHVWETLGGRGRTPAAMAQRLSGYGLSEFERRFVNVFPESEPDAALLTMATDHTWKVF